MQGQAQWLPFMHFCPGLFYGSSNLAADLSAKSVHFSPSQALNKNLEKNFECVINNSLISLNSRQKMPF
jgi:hypothetical protein